MSTSSPSTTNIILTALHPRLECCLDTEYGTLVLQGTTLESSNSNSSVSVVDMDSLATLHHDGTTCVPLQLEPRLKQNLQDLLVNNEAPAEETLQCFLRDARLVFQAVMVSQTQHKTVSISS